MKVNALVVFFCAWSSMAAANQSEDKYSSFVNNMYQESDIIKSKALELESELLRAQQTNLYFLPKVAAESKYKTDDAKGAVFDHKITANSLIYSTSIIERFKEKDSKIRAAEISLSREKESLYKSIVENLIGIKYYSNLNLQAAKLEQTATDLYNQIEARYSSGVAKTSDVEQARLLVQKIKTESESISKEIELLKANIELSTGVNFPADVELPDNILSKINAHSANEKDIYNNLDYQILSEQADAAKFNAKQQDSFLQVSLVAEEKYDNNERVAKDSYAGVQLSMNIFDFDKKIASGVGMLSYKALKSKMDFKYKELLARMKSVQLTLKSTAKEIAGLEAQRNTTEMILASQRREYNISQSSYYEMLNTQFDYFALQRRISEMKISYAINKVSLLQVSGELLRL
ncbi:TolC family protein [Edwardsiella hoshinae]|uniref:Type I secretion outer membrane protein, TolC family n=1 Tax=Edwardsiella hoshinae TaxID=93378 RepID=A0A376D8X6_9GAMM|nr:TolC family protein [Edwardsiella hoshinae]QPR28373.1 TolC family protein [Edwardsiella hoshinae]STC83608.1 type I secretion outer membrane protein, TolC family [Edwardsiella hoshinae]